MMSLRQTRENLKLIENALNELAEVDLWKADKERRFNQIFGNLNGLHKIIRGDLKELEAKELEKWKITQC